MLPLLYIERTVGRFEDGNKKKALAEKASRQWATNNTINKNATVSLTFPISSSALISISYNL